MPTDPRNSALGVVYDEATELNRQQQLGIDLIYNKLNWILVSDVVLLAGLYSIHCANLVVILFVSLSALVALMGFDKRTFNTTAMLSEQLEKHEEASYLRGLVAKKIAAHNSNLSQLKEITMLLQYSSWLLMAAIALQLFVVLW